MQGGRSLCRYAILRRLKTRRLAGLPEHDKPRPLRGLLVFDAPPRRPMKRHDDERTGWRDHGLQVRLVHP